MLCYSDYIALIAYTEDGVQRILCNSYLSFLKFNMKISTYKTKAMSISKESIHCKAMSISKENIHCKLEIDGKMVEQVVEFNYMF
jgi:hypothetical protein